MSVSMAALGIPNDIASMIQERTLERIFHDVLFAKLIWRSEAVPEHWQANLGEEMLFTRAGLIPVSVTPLVPGTDPVPSSYSIEQWRAIASQFGNTIDTHMPTSYVSLAPTYSRNIQQLGLNSAQTLDRLTRNPLLRAYLGGNTNTIAAALLGATTIRVASLNGFTEQLINGRPQAVSAANPLPIVFSTAEPANTVIGFVPDVPGDVFGPGTLTLGAALVGALAARVGVRALTRSRIIRSGGGATVDALVIANILTIADIQSAVALLRSQNVPTHADGFYHCHLSPTAEQQLFQDNAFQRIYQSQSLPVSDPMRQFVIGELFGVRFYRNNTTPDEFNVGALVATGSGGAAAAMESSEIGAEVINNAGVRIGRTVVTGGGAIYEKYLDEGAFITEAGVQGKITGFAITNQGVLVYTDRIRLILRAPQDRLQQVVSSTWSWSGDFPIPSDGLSGNTARFKRAVVVEHAVPTP